MTNKLTLLIDGNYMLRSRSFYFEKGFSIDSTSAAKEAVSKDLIEMLARSVSHVLGKFPCVDNVVVVADGGSWRKEVPVTEQMHDEEYKGNRHKESTTDWTAIFDAFSRFLNCCKNQGITVSQHYGIEGDDWMWFWTRKLNQENINTLIWSSDCDLKQLVQTRGNVFTAWWNGKMLVLPESCRIPDDPMDFFMSPQIINPSLDALRHRNNNIEYINPDTIVLDKVLCGDAGDNIPAVVWFTKGKYVYKFSPKDKKLLMESISMSKVQDLKDHMYATAEWIINSKKFKPYAFRLESVVEQLRYNLKVVWLNEEMEPVSILPAMAAAEYKTVNTHELKQNYKLMTEPDSTIEDIFAEI